MARVSRRWPGQLRRWPLSDHMLLEHLYRISLEKPDRWAMFIGLPANTMRMADSRVDLLTSYINGFRESMRLQGLNESETTAFFDWLIDEKKEFPCEGWTTKYLRDCNQDHLLAIGKFWN